MKTDKYTKIVLTVIAFVLTANLIKGSLTPAIADGKHYATVPLNPDGSITVKLVQSEVVDVRLRGIDEASNLRWEAIKVKVER